MTQEEILEKGLSIIYANIKMGLDLNEEGKIDYYVNYIELMTKIFELRFKHGVKTKTSYIEKKIILKRDKKLNELELVATKYFLDNPKFLKIAVEEGLKGIGWKDRFYEKTGLKR